jgi:predicted transcriptional regulator
LEDEELNSVLQLLENPIRRKIIKRLSHGASYPLQLSKELSLGQPLVARHLAVMEKAGLVTSTMQASPGAPDRRRYRLAKSVSITLDVAPNLFMQRGVTFDTIEGKGFSDRNTSLMSDVSKITGRDEKAISSLSTILDEVDRRLEGMQSERAALLHIRNAVMTAAAEAIAEMEGEDKRRVVYNILEEHTRDVEEISESLDLRETVVREILKDLWQVPPGRGGGPRPRERAGRRVR